MAKPRRAWIGLAAAGLLLAACRKEPYVKLEGEVDFQSDEDDEVGQPPPVTYGPARYGGRALEHARCGDKAGVPEVDREILAAFRTSRNVDDPKLLEQALQHAEKAVKLLPDLARAHLFLGSSLAKLQRNREALREYETFVLSCPREMDAHRVVRLLKLYEERRAEAKGRR